MDEKSKSDSKSIERVKLLITIVERGKGDEVIEELRDIDVSYNMACMGSGTTQEGLVEILGFADEEVDVILSVVRDSMIDEVISMIEYVFDLDEPGTGLAFAVPVEGVSGPVALKYISGLLGSTVKK
ncbi:MAG: hypothetical protein LBN22_08600 [Clostridiales Family XIII bacterium]|jgi:nitrogen regulatory protein PII|nr:hypothetical protein [Clostridiales Family XIII bacterium]